MYSSPSGRLANAGIASYTMQAYNLIRLRLRTAADPNNPSSTTFGSLRISVPFAPANHRSTISDARVFDRSTYGHCHAHSGGGTVSGKHFSSPTCLLANKYVVMFALAASGMFDLLGVQLTLELPAAVYRCGNTVTCRRPFDESQRRHSDYTTTYGVQFLDMPATEENGDDAGTKY